jgi:hypothetical protein
LLCRLRTNLFAGTRGCGVFSSTNNGISWTPVNTGLTNTDAHALAVSGTSLFAGTGAGVFLSTNSGTTWTQANEGLWASLGPTFYESITCLARSGQNLFAVTEDAGVFLSTDNGTSWRAVNEGLPKHVMDHGVTGYPVDCLTTSGQHLFAGASGGVYHSTNNGTDWTPVSSGLANVGVTCLTVSGMNLFVGTWVGGVWRRPLSEMITAVKGSSEVPTTFALKQDYPNPFNPTTVVSCQVPVACNVKLVVYNLLGQEVAVLVDKQKPAGRYEFKCDGTGFASGVYV